MRCTGRAGGESDGRMGTKPLPSSLAQGLPLGPGVAVLAWDGNGVVAFDKPAGVLSHPNRPADQPRSLLAAAYDLDEQAFRWSESGGERRLWLLNRLDGATSGVILAAADAALAREIRGLFARKAVQKAYVARVFGRPSERRAVWRDLLAVEKRGGQVRTSAKAGNIPAETAFRFLADAADPMPTALVRLEPRTGRSHQLRVQCAKRHLPIVGDQTYGDFGLNRTFAKATGLKRLFLHSLETRLAYDWRGRTHEFRAEAPLPAEFGRLE